MRVKDLDLKVGDFIDFSLPHRNGVWAWTGEVEKVILPHTPMKLVDVVKYYGRGEADQHGLFFSTARERERILLATTEEREGILDDNWRRMIRMYDTWQRPLAVIRYCLRKPNGSYVILPGGMVISGARVSRLVQKWEQLV